MFLTHLKAQRSKGFGSDVDLSKWTPKEQEGES